MLLSRQQFVERLVQQGMDVEPGSPMWAVEEHRGVRSQWFLRLITRDHRDEQELGQQAICYMIEAAEIDGEVWAASWWGVQAHQVAVELIMRWG